ncbi:MAG: inositol-3-phosphate synthase [Planctomycetes bacterium]|nr:inositol-3-phosphate synthase [Planctomycetota bacterium]
MERRTGIWFVGALGGVSTLVVAGIEALKAGLAGRTGLVTEAPDFEGMELVGFDDIVFGGHEIRGGDWVGSALEFARENGVLTPELLAGIHERLIEAGGHIRPGISLNCGEAVRRLAPLAAERDRRSLPEIVAALQADLRAFREKHRLDDVVVVNLMSAEPDVALPREFSYLESFLGLLHGDRRDLFPASVLYAFAAIDAGFPFVNFTSCAGSSVPALEELARRRGVPHAGRDGKTGETMVKTALAPMFVARNLRVLAWEGHNILGNRDGQVLDSPAHRQAKVRDKDGALRELLGDEKVHSGVRIDYVPSLGDWKTAWDFIHFEGFLGAKMSMQFIWQGCDSVLAAPLVIDLVRLAEFAHRAGEGGMMRHAACFFKAPYGVREHDFHAQMDVLREYAAGRRCRRSDVRVGLAAQFTCSQFPVSGSGERRTLQAPGTGNCASTPTRTNESER